MSVLKGRVFDAQEKPLTNAILKPNHSPRVYYTDEEGAFRIPLDEQPNTLLVRAQGFEPRSFSLQYNYAEELQIYLNPVEASGFNADSIITKAIGQRLLNELHYTAYTAGAYKKNRGYIKKVPFNIPFISGKYVPEKKDTGLVYVGERYTKVAYQNKKRFMEEVQAWQSGGSLMVKDWNYARDFDLNLYHDKIYFEAISNRGYYSPIGGAGHTYYHYTPLGTYYENGRKVYLIGFSPQRPYEAVLQGFLALYDSTFRVAYSDFNISPETQLEFVDSIHVVQNFGYHKNRYTQFDLNLMYRIDIAGYGGLYETEVMYDSLVYRNPWDMKIKGRLVQHIEKEDIFSDHARWLGFRSEPLSDAERHLLYTQSNNAQISGNFPEGEEGLYQEFQWKTHEILYSKYHRHFKEYSLYVDPVYYALGYNTIEGLYLRYDLPITFHRPKGDLTLTPELRYGFADDRGKYRLRLTWFYDLLEPNELELEGGHTYAQFNEDEPILPVLNSFYSLFLGNNFLKLYQKDYAKASHTWELFNGFDISTSLEYAYRQPLFNRTDFTITGNADDFTFNNINRPPIIFSNGFTPHRALTGELSIFYQFQQLYKVVNGRKYNLRVPSPELYFNWRKGFASSFSETNYDLLSGGINFNIRVGNIGVSSFDISGGKFVNREAIPFVDFKHFDGVQIFFLQPVVDRTALIKQFSTLPYYDYSSNDCFFELHFEHDFDGFLFSKSRFLRYSNLHSLLGFNYLNNYTQTQFLEFFIGVDNIFHALRIEFAGGIENFAKFNPALRFGVDFDYLHYRKNRVKF